MNNKSHEMDSELPSWAYNRLYQKYEVLRRFFIFYIFVKALFSNKENYLVSFISRCLDCSKLKARFIYAASLSSEADNVFDQAFLNSECEEVIHERYSGRTRVVVHGEIECNSGSIYLLNSFCLHYFGILASPIKGAINIAQPKKAIDYLEGNEFYLKLEKITGLKISLIESDSPNAALKIYKKLKRGESVFLRIDSLPTETNNYILTRIFNNPSVFPSAILKIAEKARSKITPMTTYKKGGIYYTEVGSPYNESESSLGELYEIANKIESYTEKQIVKRSKSYTSWHGLYNRVEIGKFLNDKLLNH